MRQKTIRIAKTNQVKSGLSRHLERLIRYENWLVENLKEPGIELFVSDKAQRMMLDELKNVAVLNKFLRKIIKDDFEGKSIDEISRSIGINYDRMRIILTNGTQLTEAEQKRIVEWAK